MPRLPAPSAPRRSRWGSATEGAGVDGVHSLSTPMITVLEILERARSAGQRLPYNEAAVLFAAAVRLAAANDSTLRARLLQIDDAGGLRLEPFDEEAPEADPAYLAPGLLSPAAPDPNHPKMPGY